MSQPASSWVPRAVGRMPSVKASDSGWHGRGSDFKEDAAMQPSPAQPLMWLLAPHLRRPLHGDYFTSGILHLKQPKFQLLLN